MLPCVMKMLRIANQQQPKIKPTVHLHAQHQPRLLMVAQLLHLEQPPQVWELFHVITLKTPRLREQQQQLVQQTAVQLQGRQQ